MLTSQLTKTSPMSLKLFNCELCDYTCSKKSDYDKHIMTRKHINAYECLQNNVKKSQKTYRCDCGKEYKFRQSLYNHRKICTIEILPENIVIQNEPDNEVVTDSSNNDIVHILLKENSDFKNMLLDMMKSTTDLVKNNTDLQKQNQDIQKQMLELCKNNSNTTINTDNSNNSKT